jgi:hypothetical protein
MITLCLGSGVHCLPVTWVIWKDWNPSMLVPDRFLVSLKNSQLTGLVLILASGSAILAQEPETPAEANADSAAPAKASIPIAPDLYQFPPSTPDALLRAARTTLRFDRVGDSRSFLRRILEMQLGDNELIELRRKAGIDVFLELRQDSRLQPEAEQLLKSINAASKAKTRSAEELSEFVKSLSVPGSVGENAATELLTAGDTAVPVLLASDKSTEAGQIANKLLSTHAASLKQAFLKELPAADATTKTKLLELIGQSGDSNLAIHLLRWQFDSGLDSSVSAAAGDAIRDLRAPESSIESLTQAVEHLLRTAESLISTGHKRFATLDSSSLSTTASESSPSVLLLLEQDIRIIAFQKESNAAQSYLRSLEIGEIEADSSTNYATALMDAKARVKAADEQLETVIQEKRTLLKVLQSSAIRRTDELAGNHLADALTLDPNNARARLLMMVVTASSPEPAPESGAAVPSEVTNDDLLNALEVAIELHCSDAAASFLRAFPKNSTDSAFNSRAPQVLSNALKSPDALVRTLAARIARTSFPGQCSSSSVSRTILAAKNGSLKPEIVIVSPDDSQLRKLQAVFEDAGFTADIAETGPDGFQLAASQLSCELFVLQAESPLWPMATTVANLRADIRTRNTPVVIIGHPRFQDRVTALAEIYEGVWFISEPAGTESLLSKMAQTNIPPAALTAEDRAAIKAVAE